MNNPKIYVAGHNGMVGSAIVRCLVRQGMEAIDLMPTGMLYMLCAYFVRYQSYIS